MATDNPQNEPQDELAGALGIGATRVLVSSRVVRRLLLALGVCCAAVLVSAQTSISIPPSSLMPPVIVFPAAGFSGTLTSNLLFSPDNTYDIGASGATRPRNLYVANQIAGAQILAGANSAFQWTGRSSMLSSADKLVQLEDNAGATGVELNFGVPTLGTCTAGALTSGSHNFGGSYTGNTSGSCIINFGTPNWTNAPFCVAMSQASTTHPRVSAASASSITVTGGVSGEAITYHCDGRVGT